MPFLELGAKLGKEIGGTAADDTRPVIFNFFTNLNPLALAGPTPPGWPDLRVSGEGRYERSPATPKRPARTREHTRAPLGTDLNIAMQTPKTIVVFTLSAPC